MKGLVATKGAIAQELRRVQHLIESGRLGTDPVMLSLAGELHAHLLQALKQVLCLMDYEVGREEVPSEYSVEA